MPTMRTLHRRLAAWMALVAMVFGTLAPSVALATRSGDAGSWVEICTSMGLRSVWTSTLPADQAHQADRAHEADSASIAPADKSMPGSTLSSMEPCPWCSLHAPVFGLPSASSCVAPVLDASGLRPWAFWHAPYTLYAWYRAQPRAPPLPG